MRRRAVWFVTVALASAALLLPGASSAQQPAQPQAAADEPCDHAMSAEWKRAQDAAP
jgi:hypothetical protein